jgi:hypothetical protein
MIRLATFLIVSLLLLALPAHARDINAASCLEADVQTAINAASDGDRVLVPPGRCRWTTGVTVPVGFGLTIKGAGIDRTTIVDDVFGHTLTVPTTPGKAYRVTGFTWQRGTRDKHLNQPRIISVTGAATAVRVDHNRFECLTLDNPKTRAIQFRGSVVGVVDNNQFIGAGGLRCGVSIDHTTWGGGSNNHGDGSWADDTHWGTNKFVIIEDNVFTGVDGGAISATDSGNGGRWVFRHNELQGHLVAHGSEAGDRGRGTRVVEIYENTITKGGKDGLLLQLRSGTAVVWNNTVTGLNLLGLINNRSRQNYATWKSCDGSFSFDLNDRVVYDSGIHNGPNDALHLTDTTKNWTPDRWSGEGFSVRNTRRREGGYVTSNTSTTINLIGTVRRNGTGLRFNRGDAYQILRARFCMDAPGSGKGDLISGNPPMPERWPNQERDPIYTWGNTIDGTPNNTIGSRNPHIVNGRDYFAGLQKPNYTPFTYPHPLRLCGVVADEPCDGGSPTAPRAPTNLRVN